MRAAVAVVILAAVGAAVVTASQPAAGAEAATGPVPRNESAGGGVATVLVLVPDLRWATAPAALDGYAKANLSVRAARARGDAADGYLSIGKGARTDAPGDIGVGRVVEAGEGLRLLDWERLQRHDESVDEGGSLGTLAHTLTSAGRRWAFVYTDPRGAAAAADRAGSVPVAIRGDGPAVTQALTDGAEALVVAVDIARLPSVLDAATAARCVVVASVSTPAENRHLGLMATSDGCGLGDGGLESTSTHQPGVTTITDVTPTFLSLAGVARPKAIAGGRVEPAPPATTGALVRRAERAHTADGARTPLVWLFVALHLTGAAVALLRPRTRIVVALGLLAIPSASYLMMAAPWWRAGFVGAVLTGGAVAAALAVTAAVVSRGDGVTGAMLLSATTLAVIGIDALFRSPLQVDAPFGNSPISAGRFFGVGNIGFAFLASSAIVTGGLLLIRWGRRALPWVAALLAAVIVVDGAPWFGADAGGVLAATPAFGVLILGWMRDKPDWRRMLVLAMAAVAIVAVFALIDASRPAGEQTHLGRSLGGDNLGDVIASKATRAAATLTTPMANVVWIGGGALLLLRRRLSFPTGTAPMAVALLVAGIVGSAVNDSGLQVGAGVCAMAWPAFLVVGRPAHPDPAPSADRPLVGHESRN